MKLELYLPVTPYSLNQPFGNNPLNADGTSYYAKFLDSTGHPMKGHMGTDLKSTHGQPVYAPCDGMAFYVGPDPHGGDGIYVQATGTYDYEGGQAYMRVIHWHLCSKDDPQYKPLIPTDGASYPVKAGDLLGYADNTGAPFESNGDHLHWGLLPVHANGQPIHPDNGFGGCVDIMPYWNGKFAASIPVAAALTTSAQTVVDHIAASPIPNEQKSPLLVEMEKIAQFIATLI